MRYARSKANHTYKFGHDDNDSLSDDEMAGELQSKKEIVFDLYDQHVIDDRKDEAGIKLKTEEPHIGQSRSISLKKIEVKTEMMLTRNHGNNKNKYE